MCNYGLYSIAKIVLMQNHAYTLRFPFLFTCFGLLLTAIGGAACVDRFWHPFLFIPIEEVRPKWEIAILLAAPIGLGMILMSFQSIKVSDQSITSNWIGWQRVLDRATVKVVKETDNHYTLQDASGRKLAIHRMMEHAGLLLS